MEDLWKIRRLVITAFLNIHVFAFLLRRHILSIKPSSKDDVVILLITPFNFVLNKVLIVYFIKVQSALVFV